MSRQRFITRILGGDQEREPMAVMVVMTDGTVSWGNPAAHRMLGYAMGSLRGVRVVDVLPEQAQFIRSVFVEGRPLRMQTRIPKADGRSVDVTLTAQPISREDGEIGSVALLCRPLAPWQVAQERDHVRSA